VSAYRIRTVSQLTGVSTATLRAWERRYGVPTPARTASAYRLYGEGDVALIRRMSDLVKQGVAAAEAARSVLATSAREAPSSPGELDPFASAGARIIDAAVRFDPDALELEAKRVLSLGPGLMICERVIGPAFRRIGELWHEGVITIAQEHLASQVILGTLIDLLRLSQPADSSRRVALACFADEDHVLGLYGAALRFASWGFRTMIIGARTPPSAIARVVSSLDPDVVALSVTIPPASAHARELVDGYADACRNTPWVVGGDASEGLRAWIEARGGLIGNVDQQDLRRSLDRALAERRRRLAGKNKPGEPS
jgi:DNA-binding transcriptional MerR regulator/methylmalonyl-CoA mutase cobalamin-binding subunit